MEIIARRKILTPVMLAARKQKITSYLIADKLHIIQGKNHNVYTVNNLSTLPPSLDPKRVCVEENENVLAFFGLLCPLSNFHPSPFRTEGKSFRCVEEYLVYKKAELAGDLNSQAKVLRASTPA